MSTCEFIVLKFMNLVYPCTFFSYKIESKKKNTKIRQNKNFTASFPAENKNKTIKNTIKITKKQKQKKNKNITSKYH